MRHKKQFSTNPKLRRKLKKENNTAHQIKEQNTKKINIKNYLNRKQKKQRKENSLDELTRDFIEYVKDTKNMRLNLNDIVKKLNVKKRRIYDITNVLEGKIFFLFIRDRLYQKRSKKSSYLVKT